jgi:hypothetical protein
MVTHLGPWLTSNKGCQNSRQRRRGWRAEENAWGVTPSLKKPLSFLKAMLHGLTGWVITDRLFMVSPSAAAQHRFRDLVAFHTADLKSI